MINQFCDFSLDSSLRTKYPTHNDGFANCFDLPWEFLAITHGFANQIRCF